MKFNWKIAVGVALLASSLPALGGVVRVKGAVKCPGEFNHNAGMRLKDAISLAGGLLKDSDANHVEIVVDGKTECADLTKLGPSPLLEANAEVIVEKFDPAKYVSVKGAVSKMGNVRFHEGMTLSDVMGEASPFKGACLDAVVIRRDAPEGQQNIKVDLSKVDAATIALNAKDTVEVPYSRPWAASDRELITIVVIGLLVLVIVSH